MNKAKKQPKNIIGEKFGDITIIAELERTVRPNGTIVRNFEAVCKCGEKIVTTYQNVVNKKQCIECKKKLRNELKMEDILHKKYNRLTIITHKREDGKVLCKCDCGKTKWIHLNSVVNNITLSCGCVQKERTKSHRIEKFSIDNYSELFVVREDKIKRDIFLSDLPELKILKSIIGLCSRKEPKYAAYYLDKGIKVCDRWRGQGGFINFIKDMGLRPSPKYKLQRLDINKDFEPDNCVWYIKK